MTRLPPRPDLEWTPEGAPRSRSCDDVYYSQHGGLDETRTVFLGGCGLPDGWRGRARFAIGELGFGTGLNALATWEMWRRTRSAGAVLHYVSVEGFPLERDEAARAHAAFPEVAGLSRKLLDQWPVRARGAQRLWFPEDGFALTVVHADARNALDGLVGAFDAWFLDGFAPARNEGMWHAALMQRIAALSSPGARMATYSVAGGVRRALADAGFEVAKAPGFAGKRERLEARLIEKPAPTHPLFPYARAPHGPVAVLGAGIAGASVSAALVRRGVETIVFEAAGDVAAGASGNAAGLVMPRLDRGDTPVSRLHLSAYLDALRVYETRGLLDDVGVVEHMEADAARADLLVDPPLPPTHFVAHESGVFHTRAGVVHPRAVVSAFLEGATVRCGAEAAALMPRNGGWDIFDASGDVIVSAAAVVIANGAALARFAPSRWAPIEYSRGQTESGVVEGASLPHALSGDGYVAPLRGGIVFGATFDPTQSPTAAADPDARVRNLEKLRRLSPDVAARVRTETLSSRAGVRTATADRAPLAGLLPDVAAFNAHHAGLLHGRATSNAAPAAAHEGLYVLGALGSRGFTLAPILGEALAAQICGEPQALDAAALDSVHPARYLVRALRRGKPIAP